MNKLNNKTDIYNILMENELQNGKPLSNTLSK